MPTPLTPEEEATSPTTSSKRLRELARQSIELARLVAQNFHAPPELLQELALKYRKSRSEQAGDWDNAWYDPKIVAAIAANPNTPKEILWELGADFPEEMFNNPVFELLLLEEPNSIAAMPTSTLIGLLQMESIPRFILEAASQDRRAEVRKIVAAHEHTPKNILVLLAGDRDILVRREVLYHHHRSLDLLGFFAKDRDVWIRRHVAAHSDTPSAVLRILADDSDETILIKVASHHNTPVDILKLLAQNFNLEIRWAVASNPSTPEYLKRKLLG